jgi:SAM-dependent methyltransferase
MLGRLTHRLADTPFLFHWLRKLPEANYRATRSRIAALRDRARPGRVLDVGCGTGEFASLFAPESYLGIDLHPGYVRFAARHNPAHRFVCADAAAWPGEGRPFDLCLVNGVLHHLDDASARALLAAVLGHTRSGGSLLVIEDVDLPGRPAAALVHALDEGSFVRSREAWLALVDGLAPIEHAETYVSGICPYQLMLAKRP